MIERATANAIDEERRRGEADERQLRDIAEELDGITTTEHARRLAVEIVAELLTFFALHSLGTRYDAAIDEVRGLFLETRGVLGQLPHVRADKLPELCMRADKLASRLFVRIGPNGTWPAELRIPYELANALRRACERDVWLFLPLMVRDGRAMLVEAGARARAIEDAFRAAAAGT